MAIKVVSFPERLQKLRNDLPAVLHELEDGYTESWYAFVCIEDVVQKSVRASTTDSSAMRRDRGAVLRIVANGKNYEYGTDDLSLDNLRRCAKELRQEVLADKPSSAWAYSPLTWDQEQVAELDPLMRQQFPKVLTATTPVHFGTPFKQDPAMTDLSWMSAEAQRLYKNLKQACGDAVTTVGVMLRQKIKTKIFIDREKNMSQSVLTSLAYAYAVSRKGRTAREIRGGKAGFEAARLTPEDLGSLAKMPARLDSAEYLKPGRYRIITGPDVTGVIAHEAFGHTQEGDTCRYGRSCAPDLRKSKVRVGNEHASIVNNAAVFSMGSLSYGQNGSHFFDDEGQLARPHVILDKGYLQTPMNDLMSSLKGDVNGFAPRQSNGKRESWRNPIMARQTNTYFTPGDKTLDEMIAMVDDGFIAEHAYGGMEDPKGMGLTAGTEYLEEIKNGKRTGRLFLGPKGGHIELSDPVPLLLKGILAKSKVDDQFSGPLSEQPTPYNKWGGCGKYHKESVEAGSGGPWILWQGINCG